MLRGVSIFGLIVFGLFGFLAAMWLPDIRRYMRIERM
jgi:hypothetical protein